MMSLYAPAIILFLWAMLAIAFGELAVFGPLAVATLVPGVILSGRESRRLYRQKHRRR